MIRLEVPLDEGAGDDSGAAEPVHGFEKVAAGGVDIRAATSEAIEAGGIRGMEDKLGAIHSLGDADAFQDALLGKLWVAVVPEPALADALTKIRQFLHHTGGRMDAHESATQHSGPEPHDVFAITRRK